MEKIRITQAEFDAMPNPVDQDGYIDFDAIQNYEIIDPIDRAAEAVAIQAETIRLRAIRDKEIEALPLDVRCLGW
jgi:hypothetical protein